MTVLIILILILPGLRRVSIDEISHDPFSKDQTRALKGIFAVCVMMHHLCTYLSDSYQSLLIFKNVGYIMVGGFFLISGYGLAYGAVHKPNYLHGFIRKRILPLLLTYYVINLFYILLRSRIVSTDRVIKYAVRSLFGLNLWFVPVMVLLYVVFCLSFRIFGRRGTAAGAVATTVAVLLFVTISFVVHRLFGIASYGRWWYNSAPCFLVGIWYKIAEDRIKPFVCRHYAPLTAGAVAIFLPLFIYYCCKQSIGGNATLLLVLEILCAVVFCIAVLLLSYRYRIGNNLLWLLGDLSFELYLSHALFISIFRWNQSSLTLFGHTFGIDMYISSDDLYLTAILVSTFVFSYAVHRLCKLIMKRCLQNAK